MLAICIPIYNTNVRPLARALLAQARTLSGAVTLVLLDDGSDLSWRQGNRSLATEADLDYAELPRNVGRAAIRNQLAQRAEAPYLLFVDGDMEVVRPDFVARYLALARQGVAVACGGHVYDAQRPARSHGLHWRYGQHLETPPLAHRRQHPHQSFKTSNFMVRRDLLRQIGFDERLRHYGHEDTLFGFRLAEAGIAPHHFDNPLRHGAVADNDTFLQKTEAGVANLHRMQRDFGLPPAFAASVRLLQARTHLHRWRLAGVARRAFGLVQPYGRRWLQRGTAPLWIFSLYKLGCLLRVEEGGRPPKADGGQLRA